ncbi:MAG: NADH-quinone oxidoreductase subunit NuoG [Trueperaceae bacterium]|nr:NADH-quinone oxidoreductase subunit NuoG [Trueperaceae bacterium]
MKVTVNDVEVDLAPGTSAIDAVFAAGYDVPYFCSQEYMSPVGACRMCLAKVGAPRKDRDGNWILDDETGERTIFAFPALLATCTSALSEGMVIDTLSEEVKHAQNGMIEFTLINHPLDCPVCDKGGACELQDRSYEYGSGRSRFEFTKRHQEKHHPLSDLITLDRERCIHCKRCVRYFEEVPGDEVLDFIDRGGHTYIGTVEHGLPSNFTGNITDICPVGALLDATSRFRGRNWEYDHTASVSLDDASGSAVVVDARTGRIERIKAGLHPEVNKSWIDDGIRFGHEYTADPERITRPLLRKDGELVEVPWPEAAAFVAERLKEFSGKDVGVCIRADATLEEGVAALALAEHLGTGQVDHAPRYGPTVMPPAQATLQELAVSDAIFVVGDVSEEVPAVDLRIKDALRGVTPPPLLPHGVPIADLRLKERMPRKREILCVAAPYRVDLMRHAGTVARYDVGGEETLFRGLIAIAEGGSADERVLGMTLAAAKAFVDRLRAAKKAVIVTGGFVLSSQAAADAAERFARAVGARQLVLGPMANAYGLEAIGVLPSHARYDYASMVAGGAKALLISNLDPAADPAVAERLAESRLLVVHDMFMTATARLAHVVLPAKSGFEKDGTVVNLEGRFMPVRAAPVDAGEAVDVTGLVRELGLAFGVRIEGRSVRSARRSLRKTLGTDLEELTGLGAFVALPRRRVAVSVAARPGVRGRALRVPTMVRQEYLLRNPHLLATLGGPALRLHPDDARTRALSHDDEVTVRVDGVPRRLRVYVTDAMPSGVVSVPALPDAPAGPADVDLDGIVVERRRLEVA